MARQAHRGRRDGRAYGGRRDGRAYRYDGRRGGRGPAVRGNTNRPPAGRGRGVGRGTPRLQHPQQPNHHEEGLQGGGTSDAVVLTEGLKYVGFSIQRQNVSAKLNDTRFRSFFGIGPLAAAQLFDRLTARNANSELRKLLMALNWLKLYDPEPVLSARWDLSEETLRVHIRTYIERIASLREDTIKWEGFGEETFMVSVDGTHCPIMEPRCDPSSKWYSHKFNGPGLAYELAIAIHRDKVVWINGPFPASTHDITIFRSKDNPADGLMARIPYGKRAVGDSGYGGEPEKVAITRRGDDAETKKFKARVKSRHENFNGRLKNFRILLLPFRHGTDKHKEVFESCCICMQHEIESGHGLFDV